MSVTETRSVTACASSSSGTAPSTTGRLGHHEVHKKGRRPVCCFVPPHIHEKAREYYERTGNQEVLDVWSKRTAVSHLYRSSRPTVAMDLAEKATDAVKEAKVLVYNSEGSTEDGKLMEALDRDGQRVSDYSHAVLKFLQAVVNRNSVDGRGMDLVNRIHYGGDFDNAFWDGEKMTYGDGDELNAHGHNIFNCFTTDGDVTWHELGHGVVQFEADFKYLGQSGALNEHWADVLGQVVLQYVNKQDVNAAEWLIGAHTIKPVEGKEYALRSMAKPGTAYVDHPVLGTDPQPAHMDNFVSTLKDNGGVHINSGIPNHAFYLAAMSLGGQSWDRAFPIWYQALCILKGQSDCDFQTFAQATLKAASNYEGGESSEEYQAVLAAWLKVGIDPNAVAISQPADPYSCVIL